MSDLSEMPKNLSTDLFSIRRTKVLRNARGPKTTLSENRYEIMVGMKNKLSLREQLENEAKEYGLIVEDVADGVEIRTPDGFRFEPDLHGLVTAQWDHDPMPNVLRRAIKDVRTYGPHIERCPEDCPCKEID